PLPIARNAQFEAALLPRLANRHGLITGTTGTGKTVSLQVLAERFSSIGVPVFVSDVKSDLTGISQPGRPSPKLTERLERLRLPGRLERLGVPVRGVEGSPVTSWADWGETDHPLRATGSDMGPMLLGRMLGLNGAQEGVLHVVFRVADGNGMLLLDMKDLRAML